MGISEKKINLPPRQDIDLAWYGPDLYNNPNPWIIEFSQSEICELELAANSITNQGYSIANINKSNIPLPILGAKLKGISDKLINGTGFVLLKNLPLDGYSNELAAMMFYGMGVHLGNPRMQNAKGHVLGHVKDIGLKSDSTNVRIYQTNERQTFHTDSSDIVGLLCLKKAQQGGESLLVSAVTIYNEMLESDPELLKLLFDPMATDRRGETPAGMDPFFSIPVFNWYKGNLSVIYQRQYIDSAQRFKNAMVLTSAHVAALDRFDELANDPRLNLSMQLEPGDIQFVYNHGLLHDRTGFIDWPEISDRRHLLRLWLSAPNDRELPEVFSQRFGSVEKGNRGGISMQGVLPCAPLGVV